LALFFAGGLAACPIPPSPATTIDVTAAATVDDEPFSPGDSVTSNLRIDQIFLSISDVEVVSDVDTNGFKLPGDAVVSLVEEPSLVSLEEVEPALYSRLRFKISRPSGNLDLPAEFEGRRMSLLMLGEADVAGTAVNFRYADERTYNIDLRSLEGMDLTAGASGVFQIRQDLSKLFEDVDLEELDLGDLIDGELIIDENIPGFPGNPRLQEIAQRLQEKMEDTFKLGEDVDKDD
jgi:hypothetical protein